MARAMIFGFAILLVDTRCLSVGVHLWFPPFKTPKLSCSIHSELPYAMCRLGEAAPNNLIHQEQRKTSVQEKFRDHIGSHWTSNPVAIRSPHKVLLSTIWTGDADRATIVAAVVIWIGHQHILPAKSTGSTYRDTLSLWKLCHMGKTSHSLTHSSKSWLKGIFYYNFRPWKLSNPNGLCYIPLANWLHPIERNGTLDPPTVPPFGWLNWHMPDHPIQEGKAMTS